MSLRETLKITFLFFSYRPTFELRGPGEFTIQLISFSSDRRKYCKYFFKQRITLSLHTNFPIRIKYRKYNRTIILHKFIRFYKRFYSKKKKINFQVFYPYFSTGHSREKRERKKKPSKDVSRYHPRVSRSNRRYTILRKCVSGCVRPAKARKPPPKGEWSL